MKIQIVVLSITVILIHCEFIYNPQISTRIGTVYNTQPSSIKNSYDIYTSINSNNVPQYDYAIYPSKSKQTTVSGTMIQSPPPINIEITSVAPPIVKPSSISPPIIQVKMQKPSQSAKTIFNQPSKPSSSIIKAQVYDCNNHKNVNNYCVQQSTQPITVITSNSQPQPSCEQLVYNEAKKQPVIMCQGNLGNTNTNSINGNDNIGLGTSNIIDGSDNVYFGDLNQINGDSNTCLGNSNQINGDQNLVAGCSNQVGGEYNKIIGNDNTVIGSTQINNIAIKNILLPQMISYNNKYLHKDYLSFQL